MCENNQENYYKGKRRNLNLDNVYGIYTFKMITFASIFFSTGRSNLYFNDYKSCKKEKHFFCKPNF